MTLASLAAPLERLDRILARAVERVLAATDHGPDADPFRGLYISAGDAERVSRGPRSAPFLGAAAGEPPLAEVIRPCAPLATVAAEQGLSSFDLDVLVLALAPEVDLRYARLYAFLQDDVARRSAGVDLALTLICPTPEAKLVRCEHFATDAPLLRGGLVALLADDDPHAPLLAHRMKVEDGVVRMLLGVGGLDPRLRDACRLLDPSEAASAVVDPGLAALVSGARALHEPLVVHLTGPPSRRKRETAHALAAGQDTALLAVDIGYALLADPDLEQLPGLITREARRHGALLYLEPAEALLDARPAAARRLTGALADAPGGVLLAGARPDPPAGFDGVVPYPLALPGVAERRERWTTELAAAGLDFPDDELDQLAARYRLTGEQIAGAVSVARSGAWLAGAPPTADELFAAARASSAVVAPGLAERVGPSAGTAELALPDDTAAQLEEMRQQVLASHRVLDEWGFSARRRRGRGVTALFAGPSGTGKTTAAENLAASLRLDLLKIDLGGVVSKYIGETEKNLERIFSAAEDANAILFFDEAEALFGRRSEVRDSHDRYANIEIAYLLERMERFDGTAILATNLRQNMDDAFVRRLRFVIEFPFPTEDERRRIWRLQFPEEADWDAAGIDFDLLATRFRIAGGSITNIALGAAFLAAADGRGIEMRDVLHATRREYQKLGRVLGPPERAAEAVAS